MKLIFIIIFFQNYLYILKLFKIKINYNEYYIIFFLNKINYLNFYIYIIYLIIIIMIIINFNFKKKNFPIRKI